MFVIFPVSFLRYLTRKLKHFYNLGQFSPSLICFQTILHSFLKILCKNLQNSDFPSTMYIIWSEKLCQNHSHLRTSQLTVIFFFISDYERLPSLGRSGLVSTLQPHIHFVSCEKYLCFIYLHHELLFHTKVNNHSMWSNTCVGFAFLKPLPCFPLYFSSLCTKSIYSYSWEISSGTRIFSWFATGPLVSWSGLTQDLKMVFNAVWLMYNIFHTSMVLLKNLWHFCFTLVFGIEHGNKEMQPNAHSGSLCWYTGLGIINTTSGA